MVKQPLFAPRIIRQVQPVGGLWWPGWHPDQLLRCRECRCDFLLVGQPRGTWMHYAMKVVKDVQMGYRVTRSLEWNRPKEAKNRPTWAQDCCWSHDVLISQFIVHYLLVKVQGECLLLLLLLKPQWFTFVCVFALVTVFLRGRSGGRYGIYS